MTKNDAGEKRTWRKVAIGIVLILVVGLGGLAIIGFLLPESHEACVEATYPVSIETLWSIVVDLETWASWNSEIQSMTRDGERDGHPRWKVVSRWGEMPSVVTEQTDLSKLVTVIPEDAGLPFFGSWTYEMKGEGEVAVLAITERGTVLNPLIRALGLFQDPNESARLWLLDLAKHLECEIVPREVAVK